MRKAIVVLVIMLLALSQVAFATDAPTNYTPVGLHGYQNITVDALTRIKVASDGSLIATDSKNVATKMTKSVDVTAGQTAQAIWTPATGKIFVITDIVITCSTGGVITVFDSTDTAANRVFKGGLTANGGYDHTYAAVTRDGAAANNVLKYTSDGTFVGIITAYGYEK